MMEKMIFLNIGYMKRYRGITEDDKISYGGSYVSKTGFGHEIFNFLPYKGHMYGFVQPAYRAKGLNISKMSSLKQKDSLNNVLVVWTSKDPSKGVCITGWYKNATIYGEIQAAPEGADRKFNNEKIGYLAKAKKEDCVLLPPEEREFTIKWKARNVWYADKEQDSEFRRKVLNYINRYESQNPRGTPKQPDVFKKIMVENIAMNETKKYYEKLGYTVKDVSKDNVGWDLNAIQDNQELKIEVKGLSQEGVLFELTHNEYEKMRKYKDSYIIGVVSNALDEPKLNIFSYRNSKSGLKEDIGTWEDKNGNQLKIKELISAKCYMA